MNQLYLVLVILNMAILSFAMYYTFARLQARGAKSLFLFLFGMLAFTTMFLCSLIVRSPEAKTTMMLVGYGVIMALPIQWYNLVYEISGWEKGESWHFSLPVTIVNAAAYGLFFIDVPNFGYMMEYHSCQLNGPLFVCRVNNSILYHITLAVIFLEMLGGIAFLLYWFFVRKHDEERGRYLFLTVAVGIGTGGMVLSGTVFNDIVGPYDPLPFVLTLWTVLMVLSVFSRRLLDLRFGPSERHKFDDLLLVIDSDHFIQDVNMSSLQVFGMEVQDIISTQLEIALKDYPNIIDLFSGNTISSDLVELEYDGVTHTFEPTVTVNLDSETSLPSGQQLILRDVTGRIASEENDGVVSIMRDPLTNQYTKSSFYQFGQRLLDNTHLREQPVSVVVIDIDDLNLINERYSHLAGDQGLIQLVGIVNGIIRSTDLLARFQQDELVLMLPNADEYEAYQICSRMMATVAENHFSYQGQEFQMTVSMGYTVSESNDDHELEAVVNAAFHALNQSHELGRNRLTYLPVGLE
jgi:diguanylate cyclase (GGDEF)-like protein